MQAILLAAKFSSYLKFLKCQILGKTQALTSDSTSNKSSTSSQEKSNGGVIDPLSQLDPLWSIRR